MVVVDGLRADAITEKTTPNTWRLLQQGVASLEAQTVMPSMTLPCHMSLFHSVKPERHGISSNIYSPQVRPVPGLFEVLQAAGLHTAMFYSWEELRDVSRPGSLKHAVFIRDDQRPETGVDARLSAQAISYLTQKPDFMFLYLGHTDIMGHAYGWMSEAYLQAVSEADSYIASLIPVLSETCLLVIASDHGGHQQSHGTDLPEDMTIPLIFAKHKALRQGATLLGTASILDIAPTIAQIFQLNLPFEWTGQSLLDQLFI